MIGVAGAGDMLDHLGREFALGLSAAGHLLWADPRGHRLLPLQPGQPVRALAAPGAEHLLDVFLERAVRESVSGVEVLLRARHRLLPVVLDAAPLAGGVAVVGTVVSGAHARAVAEIAARVAELADLQGVAEVQRAQLRSRALEVERLTTELHETGRGIVALHHELDDRDETLRRAVEMRARLVASVSHEFRTPLVSILGLSRLLLAHADGPLNAEQEKQVSFILESAAALSELVDDMLDVGRMQAGQVRVRCSEFSARSLLGTLRGVMRPLPRHPGVELVFEEPVDVQLETDAGKVGQILRNLVSNALKFTTQGEVRVRSEVAGERVVFAVADTGLGIATADQERIFEEFVQLENPLQRAVRGSGLGLSLSRRLAEMLGGTLAVESTPGEGSTFRLEIPTRHPEVREMERLAGRAENPDPSRAPVLVVEDDRQTVFLYERYLASSGFQVIPARSLDEARRVMRRLRPAAIVLDVVLDGETSWSFLQELKGSPETRDIPTLVVTVTDRARKARALGADEFHAKPLDEDWLNRKLRDLARAGPVEKVLVVDDDEVSRYLVRRMLAGARYVVLEAASAAGALELAREQRPHVIFLDFLLREETAFEVIDGLKADPRTRSIPVIVHTSRELGAEERRRLAAEASSVVSKQNLSREVAIHRIREALEKAGLGREVSDR